MTSIILLLEVLLYLAGYSYQCESFWSWKWTYSGSDKCAGRAMQQYRNNSVSNFLFINVSWIDHDPLVMGTEGACSCGGVGGRGCIEGEGPCLEDKECARVSY